MRESDIKRRACTALTKRGWLICHVIQCSLNGWPDTMALKNGRIIFIEFKQPGKKPRDLQQYRIDKLEKQGFETIVITEENQVYENPFANVGV